MKYAKQLQAIKSGTMTREELFNLREHALAQADKGDGDALVISQAILLAPVTRSKSSRLTSCDWPLVAY